ncbi:MAG TPA: decaprenyl-phosphate phosphoribosyltransferase, partial [Candidatus Glassbacteria bacterium]|nr:decaprenyl-phosphate phosphoribosyltransferase [Candidatus Glassbacteria bacterium]
MQLESEYRLYRLRVFFRLLSLIVRSMRPAQWTKNLLVFAGLVFAEKATDPALIMRSLLAFAAFCLLSSGVYLLNDLIDAPNDRLHPLKKDRPVASGRLSRPAAATAATVVACAGLLLASLVGGFFMPVGYIYFFINLLYSQWLKKLVIFDVMTVAIGMVLRVLGGTLAVGVQTSEWILICTFLLSLFLAFGKRRHELVVLENGATDHRGVLAHYSPYFLDQMIAVVTPSTLICYILYTLSPDTVAHVGSRGLVFTVPFVIYGILRYLYLIHRRQGGGDPAALLIRDPWLLAAVTGWLVVAFT